MEQRVYYFRGTLMGSDELNLLFWFVPNIYKLNIINYKLLKKEKNYQPSDFTSPPPPGVSVRPSLFSRLTQLLRGDLGPGHSDT